MGPQGVLWEFYKDRASPLKPGRLVRARKVERALRGELELGQQ